VTRTRFVTATLEASRAPAPVTVLLGVGVLAADVGRLVITAPLRAAGLDRRPPRWARRPAERSPDHGAADLAAERMHGWLQRLWDVAAAQPGGLGPSLAVLAPALAAVAIPTGWERGAVGPLYAPVEPFIPLASLA
jgi:hypothetical protein